MGCYEDDLILQRIKLEADLFRRRLQKYGGIHGEEGIEIPVGGSILARSELRCSRSFASRILWAFGPHIGDRGKARSRKRAIAPVPRMPHLIARSGEEFLAL